MRRTLAISLVHKPQTNQPTQQTNGNQYGGGDAGWDESSRHNLGCLYMQDPLMPNTRCAVLIDLSFVLGYEICDLVVLAGLPSSVVPNPRCSVLTSTSCRDIRVSSVAESLGLSLSSVVPYPRDSVFMSTLCRNMKVPSVAVSSVMPYPRCSVLISTLCRDIRVPSVAVPSASSPCRLSCPIPGPPY